MVKDVGWKDFFSDDSRYADIINGIGCGGEQIVTEEDLQEADYSLPIRNMTYDAAVYEKQVAAIRKEVRKEPKGLEAGEYLYGFRKDDKVCPVITFVLYAGSDEWDGATSLHQILNFENIPDELRGMVSDYKVNLIDIREIEDTSVFQTDVRHVFDIIRCSKDRKALDVLMQSDDYYKHMDEGAFDVAMYYAKANEMIRVKEYYIDEKGEVDMCQAIREMVEEGREEGLDLAKKIFRFYRDGKSNEEIAEECNISVSKVAEILA